MPRGGVNLNRGTGTGTGSGSAPPPQTGAGTAGVGNLLPWLYPTADFQNFDKAPTTNNPATGTVALPAIGATATVLQFRVDNGRMGKITQIGIDFVANGAAGASLYTQGVLPAQLIFSLQADGKTSFRDYEQFNYLPGAVSAPTPINGLMLMEGQVITLTVENVSIVVATQFIAARLLGYTFSKKLWPKIMGMQ